MNVNAALFVKILLFQFHVLVTVECVLDTVYLSIPPRSSREAETLVRGYTLIDDLTEDVTLDILNDDRGLRNVTWSDGGTYICDTVFSSRGKCTTSVHKENGNIVFKFLGIEILDYPNVFSFEAKKNGTMSRTAIVVTSSTAKITFEQRTLTVGLGENVEIIMTTNKPTIDLRWTHNYGDVISKWNGSSAIRIENVREQDGGVYECYQEEYGKNGNHGIMRLIVRACPSPKWNPPSCELDCPVCYNGGVCDDITGLCICPAGFKGTNCEIGCGSRYFGRFCDVFCSRKIERNCKEILFCPPDPVGCSCISGYGGPDCLKTCDTGWYGASCQQKCHCNVTYCDRKYGCNNDTCWDGYTGPQCQALPYLRMPPIATAYTNAISVDVTWTQGRDYGTGTITSWTLWYKIEGSSEFTSINSSTPDVITITGLKLHETVAYYSILSRSIEGVSTAGPASPHGIIQTTCLEPLLPSPPTIKSVSRNYLEIQWELVPNDPGVIQCDGVLRYQVGYRNTMNSNRTIRNTTSNAKRMMRISGLMECTEYFFDLRIINNAEIASLWSKAIRIKTPDLSETSDGLLSQITTIALAIISGISIAVMSGSLWLLRKAKQQIRNLSMSQKQVENVYVNQSPIINQANGKDVSEDVYMYSMPTNQHIYTDLKTK